MNIQEYISSGIVESYVLGMCTPEEQQAFEALCAAHEEIRQARDAFESSLESHARAHAQPVPAAVKQLVWDKLDLGSAPSVSQQRGQAPVMPLKPVRSLSMSKLLAAASVTLLLGSTLLNVYFYNQYRTSASRLQELIASNQQLAGSNQVIQARLQQYENGFEKMKDTNMAIVAMKGLPLAPQSLTTVYWHRQTKDVYLMINNLPQPAPNKQYQLWAIVDGKPVDAGLIDNDGNNGLVKMKNIPRAQAFAITLEKKGGSPAPDMNAMYVMGKI